MDLSTILVENRDAFVAKWFDAIIGTYPPQASQFLAKQKDQFRNPVGYAIHRSVNKIVDQIAGDLDPVALREALDGIVRIRSVQEFSPSEAIAFVFQLKTVVRDLLGSRVDALVRSGELASFDEKVDRVAMAAFDKYMECRQTLFDIRTDEIRKQSAMLLGRYTSKPRASQEKGDTVDDVN